MLTRLEETKHTTGMLKVEHLQHFPEQWLKSMWAFWVSVMFKLNRESNTSLMFELYNVSFSCERDRGVTHQSNRSALFSLDVPRSYRYCRFLRFQMCCILQSDRLTCNYRRVSEKLWGLRQTDGPLQVVKLTRCKVRLCFMFIDYTQFKVSDGLTEAAFCISWMLWNDQ